MRSPGLTPVDVFVLKPLGGDLAARLPIAVAYSVSR